MQVSAGSMDVAAGSPLSWSEFDELTAGDRDLQREILQAFRSECPSTMESLRLAIEGLDPTAAARAAHRLKGSLLTTAAHEAARLARDLEQAGREGDLDRTRVVFPALVLEMERLLAAMTRAIEEGAR